MLNELKKQERAEMEQVLTPEQKIMLQKLLAAPEKDEK
jgi:Spy/CpxP family protein refolding chaperone